MQPGTDRTPPRLTRLLLGALSLPFKAVAYARLRAGARRARAFPDLFIVSVDSLSFGGAGKTPLVMAIGEALQARGARFAVVSRGYRSRLEKEGGRVEPGHTFRDVGDEARMMKARFPRQEVLVGRDRLRSLEAARALGARIVLLDDGLQTAHVRKDLSIMLVQPGHPYFYLRHFRFLARRADIALRYRPGGGGYEFTFAGFLDAAGRPQPVGDEPLVAFSALGDNARFRRDMERFRLAAFRGFPDHHAFSAADLEELESLRRGKGAAWLACTEKDFCKLDGVLPAGVPLLRARNEIQLPGGVLAAVIAHAEAKGFL